MRIARLLVLGLTLLEILHVALAMQPGQPTGPRAGGSCTQPESFEGWTAPYRTAPEHGAWGRRPAHWAVTITRAGPHDLVSLPGPSHLLSLSSPSGACEAWEPTQTYFISDEGTTSWVWLTGGGSHGGGTEIGAEPFRHFKLLMAHLPPGLHRLPPPSRRLVTQVVEASGVAVRVYDQAQLPNDILELLRLLGADTWPVTDYPQFQPEKRCTAAAFATAGSPASLETTDPSQLHRAVLATGLHHHLFVTETIPSMGPTTVIAEDARAPRQAPYDPGLQSVLRIETAPARGDAGAVLHEFRTPMNGRTWIRTYAARFTPDGRYLLTMNNAPGVQFYDTATWQPVAHIAGIPDRLLAYYPSADWARGIAVFPTGQIALLDGKTHRRIATIDPGSSLVSAVFSPDDTEVAVLTTSGEARHLGVWKTVDGAFVHALRTREESSHPELGDPIWTPGGRYLQRSKRSRNLGRPGRSLSWLARRMYRARYPCRRVLARGVPLP